jgi:hypothetical protein
MTTGSCARLFEVEAMRDGRLGGAELASFGRHLTGCPACLHEVQALEALVEPLRQDAADLGVDDDELRIQRERTRLLAAFDRGLLTGGPRRSSGRRLLWPATAAMMVACLLVAWRWRQTGPPGSTPSVAVRAQGAAVWSKRHAGPRQEITLRRGSLWIRVQGAGGPGGLVVKLPDGELVDRGTTFTVSAEDGRTTGVEVQEGSVELRRHGLPPLVVDAPGRWALEQVRPPTPVPPPEPAPPAEPAPPPEPAPRRARPIVKPPAPAVERLPEPEVEAPTAHPVASVSPPQPPPPSGPVQDDAALAFRAAVAALDAGAHREASAAFARFLIQHPGDRRAEDAAYLQIIALQRLGARAEMLRAVEAYLHRHPAGFRRREVERLSGNPQTHPR